MSTVSYNLDHLRGASRRYVALIVVLLLASFATLVAVGFQIADGLVATDMAQQGTQGGATWGLYIGTFEWFAGMAVGALAVTGYIRFFEYDEYDLIARVSNIWAFICGVSAAWLIVIDLGTPHRVLGVLAAWPSTVTHSPLAWDVTFVTTLLVFTVTMLWLSLRLDFLRSNRSYPFQTRVVKRLVSITAQEDEIPKLRSMRQWLGLGLLVLALTAGLVPGLLLGVVGGQPGFFGSERGIVFIASGLLTGVGLVALTAGVLRMAYGWSDRLGPTIMDGIGRTMTIFGFVFLIVLFADIVTVVTDMAPFYEQRIGEAQLFGEFAPVFWLSVGLIGFPTLVLAIFQENLGVPLQTLAAALILVGVWIKSNLTVIEPLLYPNLPGFVGTYNPTLIEWMITFGSIAIAALLFAIAIKIIPLSRTGDLEVPSS